MFSIVLLLFEKGTTHDCTRIPCPQNKRCMPCSPETCWEHLILELDVCQLVFQFCQVRAPDNVQGLREGQLKHEVFVKRLGVEDSVVGQDLVVQSDPVF